MSTTPVPGGFYCVVTSQTVGQHGRLIGPLRLNQQLATLRIHRRTFAGQAQITVTEPYSQGGSCQGGRGIGDGGFRGFTAVGGVGILLQRGDGSAYRGQFRRPLVIRLSSPLISPSSIVVMWNGRRFVGAPHAVVRRGFARASVSGGTDFAVLTPAPRQVRPRATMALRVPPPAWDFLAAARLTPAGAPMAGLAVLTAALPRASAPRGAVLTP